MVSTFAVIYLSDSKFSSTTVHCFVKNIFVSVIIPDVSFPFSFSFVGYVNVSVAVGGNGSKFPLDVVWEFRLLQSVLYNYYLA